MMLFLFLISTLLSSCGLPDEYFLPQVPSGNIVVKLNTSAEIRLPSISPSEYPFTHFSLYYRIYISDSREIGRIDTDEKRREINSALNTDFNSFLRYTDSTNNTVNVSGIGSVFRERKYYELEIEGNTISSLLNSSGNLLIDFPSNEFPYLEIGGNRYNLLRSTGGGNFSSGPFSHFGEAEEGIPNFHKYFHDTPQLHNGDNITVSQNLDVAGNQNMQQQERNTFVSIYIITTGYNSTDLTVIFGRPTHVGVFRLPEEITNR